MASISEHEMFGKASVKGAARTWSSESLGLRQRSAMYNDVNEKRFGGDVPQSRLRGFDISTATDEYKEACAYMRYAQEIRSKYVRKTAGEELARTCLQADSFLFKGGLVRLRADDGTELEVYGKDAVPDLKDFVKDHGDVIKIVCDTPNVKTAAYRRIKDLRLKFNTHLNDNIQNEEEAQKKMVRTDLYTVAKVDNHIHLSAAFPPSIFLTYIKKILRRDYDRPVVYGKTLGQICTEDGLLDDELSKEENLKVIDTLSMDSLAVASDCTCFQRFDNFNDKYRPFRSARLRTAFLKTSNDVNGEYLADLTKLLFEHTVKVNPTTFQELRISVYGRDEGEWERLSKYVQENKLHSSNNKWIVQCPRIYNRLAPRVVKSFAEGLTNFWAPLFKATLLSEEERAVDPLAQFLAVLSGFDSVDDESNSDLPLSSISADEWTSSDNPSYAYQLYHFFANMKILNALRRSRGLNEFQFRPHAGEAGSITHCVTAYMLADGICHGIQLANCFPLQYLFYLDQIGLSISPTSNNQLFQRITHNPFLDFFESGMNVTLSTDDPLIFHLSDQPLLEEYSLARQVWRLSNTDICEIARNSVRQSGFSTEWKEKWIGKEGEVVDPDLTNIPVIRSKFRDETLFAERHNFVISSRDFYSAILRKFSGTDFSSAKLALQREMSSGESLAQMGRLAEEGDASGN